MRQVIFGYGKSIHIQDYIQVTHIDWILIDRGYVHEIESPYWNPEA